MMWTPTAGNVIVKMRLASPDTVEVVAVPGGWLGWLSPLRVGHLVVIRYDAGQPLYCGGGNRDEHRIVSTADILAV